MYSKLFEAIYLECNSGSGVSNDFDTELEKPLESEKLFERVYYECHVKPLLEGTLNISLNSGNTIKKEPKSGHPYLAQYADKIIDVLNRIHKNDKTALQDDSNFQKFLPYFYVADIAPINQKLQKEKVNFRINGDFFDIGYNTIKNHHINRGLKANDNEHILDANLLKTLGHKILNPFIIASYNNQKDNLDFYINIKIAGQYTLIGTQIKNGKIVDIRTVFGKNNFDKNNQERKIYNVIYADWKSIFNDINKNNYVHLIDLLSSPNLNQP
jgi:hypothetical protein